MTKKALLIVGLLAGAYLCVPGGRTPGADEKAAVAPGGEFKNQFVAINYKAAGGYQSQLLQHVAVRRLGGREFLVGEYCMRDDGPAEWRGAVLWAPVENLDTIMAFADKEKALAVVEAALKAAREK